MEQPFWGDMEGKAIEVNIRKMQTITGLDAYGVRLANRGHSWSHKERKAFEKRVRELTRKK